MEWNPSQLQNRVQSLTIPIPRVKTGNQFRFGEEQKTQVNGSYYLLAQQIKTMGSPTLWGACCIMIVVAPFHHVSNHFHSFGYSGSLAHSKPGRWSCVEIHYPPWLQAKLFWPLGTDLRVLPPRKVMSPWKGKIRCVSCMKRECRLRGKQGSSNNQQGSE